MAIHSEQPMHPEMTMSPNLGSIRFSKWLVFFAAISACVSVGIGAMGAHSLPKRLLDSGFSEGQVQKKIEQCETAVEYHMVHSLAVLALGLCPMMHKKRAWYVASLLFIVGIGLFSGGIYSIVFLDRMGHWSIVPLGGVSLMLGWITVAFGAIYPDKLVLSTGKPAG